MVLALTIITLVCCLDSLAREHRFLALNSISKLNSSKIFINSISLFLESFSGSVNKKDCYEPTSDWEIMNNTKKDISSTKRLEQSGMFSSRENSARGLVDEDFFNENKTSRKLQEQMGRNQSVNSEVDRKR